jgi:hypothetical protein
MHDDFSGLSLGGLPARIRKAAEQGKKGRDSVVCLLEYTSKIVERTCNEVVDGYLTGVSMFTICGSC